MAELKDYSTTAASNNSASPNGMPEGMAPSGVNDSWREGVARLMRYYEDVNAVNSLAGGTTAYTLAASRTISSYAAGDVFVAVCNATNTGATTLNIDSVGAKSVVTTSQTPLEAGQLVINGIYMFAYDANNDVFIVLNPNLEITDQTAVTTLAAADEFAVYDADATALRKVTFANMITGTTALTSLADADEFLVHDDDASAPKKITATNARVGLAYSNTCGFHATPASDQTGVVTGDWRDVTYATETYDFGTVFGSSTFTAPAAGEYLFTWSVATTTSLADAKVFATRIQKNSTGAGLAGARDVTGTTTTGQLTCSAIVQLALNDTIHVQVFHNHGSNVTLDADGSTSGIAMHFAGVRLG